MADSCCSCGAKAIQDPKNSKNKSSVQGQIQHFWKGGGLTTFQPIPTPHCFKWSEKSLLFQVEQESKKNFLSNIFLSIEAF